MAYTYPPAHSPARRRRQPRDEQPRKAKQGDVFDWKPEIELVVGQPRQRSAQLGLTKIRKAD
jgi:hypothetical protein